MSRATQTSALFLDAYRDLQSRKLFWVTLSLSLLVAGSFAFVGINERGYSIFGKTFPSPFNSLLIPPPEFYKTLFINGAIPYWLGLFATILGLVSCGGIFPDLLGSGSIDLYLSRPISRLRLFLTKYAFGLLFMALQVLLFSVASFLVIGFRGGLWEWGIFLAVPLVTLFFSYLYCLCVLLGVWMRSSLAAILLTLLLWAVIASINFTDNTLTVFRAAADERTTQAKQLVDFNNDIIDRNNALPKDKRSNVSAFEFQRDQDRKNLDEDESTSRDLRFWQNLFLAVKAPLPKTGETVELMSRWLIPPEPLEQVHEAQREHREEMRARRGFPTTRNQGDLRQYLDSPQVQEQVVQEFTGRAAAGIIGSSLGFEAFILAIAAWIFCSRDY